MYVLNHSSGSTRLYDDPFFLLDNVLSERTRSMICTRQEFEWTGQRPDKQAVGIWVCLPKSSTSFHRIVQTHHIFLYRGFLLVASSNSLSTFFCIRSSMTFWYSSPRLKKSDWCFSRGEGELRTPSNHHLLPLVPTPVTVDKRACLGVEHRSRYAPWKLNCNERIRETTPNSLQFSPIYLWGNP